MFPFLRLLVALVFVFFALTAKESFAHGISCNGAAIDFEESFDHSFIFESLTSPIANWGELNSCAGANLASGTGNAACINAQSLHVVDAVMESYDFDLSCLSNATLSFRAYLENPLADARLLLEAKRFNDSQWVQVSEWQSLAAFSSLQVPLTAFSGSGLSTSHIRFRFVSPASVSPAQAQIDNVILSCANGASADLNVTAPSPLGVLPLGARRTYKVEVANYGPDDASNVALQFEFSKGSGQFVGTSSLLMAGATILPRATKDILSASVRWVDGDEIAGGLRRAELEVQVSSNLCDVRLPNNTRRIAVLLDPNSKQRQNVVSGYKKTEQLIKSLKKAKSCSALKKAAGVATSLTSSGMKSSILAMNPDGSLATPLLKSISKISKKTPVKIKQCMSARSVALKKAKEIRKLWKEGLL